MKLVLDTNTVVSGFFMAQRAAPDYRCGGGGRITLATSTMLVDELAEVISRAKFARKIAEQGLSVSALLDRYTKLAARVTPTRIRRVVLTDADDDHVLACALAAQADWIVSGDSDLLNLKHYQGMRIIDAGEALRSLAQ